MTSVPSVVDGQTVTPSNPKQTMNESVAAWLLRLRWLPFTAGVSGLCLMSWSLLYAMVAQPTFHYRPHDPALALAGFGLLLALVASTAFSVLSLGGRVWRSFGPDETLVEQSLWQRLPWLTVPRLRRASFWLVFLSLAGALAAALLSGIQFISSPGLIPVIQARIGWAVPSVSGTEFLYLSFSLGYLLVCGLSCGQLLLGARVDGPSGGDGSLLLHQKQPERLPVGNESGDAGVEDDHEPAVVTSGEEQLVHHLQCPVCCHPIDDEPVHCQRCQTAHHRECWQYVGGCAIFGCDSARWQGRGNGELRGEIDRVIAPWIMAYKAHWAMVVLAVAAVVSFTAGSLFPVRALTYGSLFGTAARIGAVMQGGGIVVATVALALYGCLLLWHRRIDARLQSVTRDAGQLPQGDHRLVVDRLDETGSFSSLASVLLVAVVTIVVTTVFAGLTWSLLPRAYEGAYMPLQAMGLSLAVMSGVSCAFLGALYAASRRRLAYVQSMQNRLAASLKKDQVVIDVDVRSA